MIDLPQAPSAPEICFVACHPAAGSHFADFYYELSRQGRVRCRMIATEKAADMLRDRSVPVEDFFYGKKLKVLKDLPDEEQDQLAAAVAHLCRHARCVITDLGQDFSAKVHAKLAERYPSILRAAYYDNPETFVPGGYSLAAAKGMQKAQAILFANAKLIDSAIYAEPNCPIDLRDKHRFGIGYGNTRGIEELCAKRKSTLRSSLRSQLSPSPASPLIVYFGGANEVYYQKAFPRFLEIITRAAKSRDLSAVAIVIQQHPRSILEGNRDGQLVFEWKKTATEHAPQIYFSSLPFNDAVTAADLALYYQTSAAATFMLAGVPTAQIGHEPYQDVLVRNHFCPSITDEKQLIELLDHLPPEPSDELRKKVAAEAGLNPAWPEQLAAALSVLVK